MAGAVSGFVPAADPLTVNPLVAQNLHSASRIRIDGAT